MEKDIQQILLSEETIRRRVEEQRGETAFSLISGDYLGFAPKKICD